MGIYTNYLQYYETYISLYILLEEKQIKKEKKKYVAALKRHVKVYHKHYKYLNFYQRMVKSVKHFSQNYKLDYNESIYTYIYELILFFN